jgi:hypothetical protein
MDPLRDARHELWPAGDCFLIYPGGASCIRFEKLREGIVDFEKIRILKAKAAGTKNPKTVKHIAELDLLLKKILEEKEFDKEKLKGDVKKGNDLVKELTAILYP